MAGRTLGRTGLATTRLGLGLAALGRPGYINLGHARDLPGDHDVTAMRDHVHGVLDAAWERGVRYFDAARSYGRAEEFLGEWLAARNIGPREVTVGSKWGYTYTADWQVEAEVHEVKEHSLRVLRRQRAESHVRLGAHLKLYQIHSATLDSGVLDNAEVLSELGRYREEGLAIGLSSSGVGQVETLRRALAVTLDGEALFGCVQATWNLLEPSAGDALREAHEAGLGVIVKEALANGRLAAGNHAPEFAARRALLEEEAAGRETTLDALALAAALAQPWADVVLSGAARVGHLRSNLAATSIVWDEALEARLASLAEPPEVYWQTRSELAWN